MLICGVSAFPSPSTVLVVVMFDVQGAQVLTAAVTQAVQDSMVAATADVVALNAATIVVEVAGNGGAEARRLANSVLSLQCTIPVPSVSEGKAVVAAAQTSVADGDVAAAVSLSVGGGSVSVIMPAAHVTTQDGTQITANLIKVWRGLGVCCSPCLSPLTPSSLGVRAGSRGGRRR